jgi:ABC-type oligopeptide transport system ATPase subunit
MNRGEIVEMDDAEAIFEHPANDYTSKLLSAVPEVRVRGSGA